MNSPNPGRDPPAVSFAKHAVSVKDAGPRLLKKACIAQRFEVNGTAVHIVRNVHSLLHGSWLNVLLHTFVWFSSLKNGMILWAFYEGADYEI
jgi:hypothetical protein